ncbi:MAG: Integrase core domain, partial [Firmicutes bacterium]|nr:Integrase core domain [Bacillota bacterium]
AINSYEDVKEIVEEYLYYYNNERFQARLKGMTPVSYRRQHF